MAFLDHVNVSSPPARIGDAHVPFNKHWSAKPGICLHHGKTKIWNSQDEKPECVDAFSREARHRNPEAFTAVRGKLLPSFSTKNEKFFATKFEVDFFFCQNVNFNSTKI